MASTDVAAAGVVVATRCFVTGLTSFLFAHFSSSTNISPMLLKSRSRLKEAWLLLIRKSLWIDTLIVAIVMLIELFGVYVAGGMVYEAKSLLDPFRNWIGDWLVFPKTCRSIV
jgi:hypothetical protein